MKKLLVLCLAAVAAASAAAAPSLGVAAGYLIDGKESFISARLGFDVAQSPTATHQLELEVGYTKDKESGVEGKIIPVMANYRIEAPLTSPFGVFAGAGVGFSRVRVSGLGLSDSDNAFSAQAFAGLMYTLSPNTAVTAGARYLWIGDAELFGFEDEVGDDVSLELGLRFRF